MSDKKDNKDSAARSASLSPFTSLPEAPVMASIAEQSSLPSNSGDHTETNVEASHDSTEATGRSDQGTISPKDSSPQSLRIATDDHPTHDRATNAASPTRFNRQRRSTFSNVAAIEPHGTYISPNPFGGPIRASTTVIPETKGPSYDEPSAPSRSGWNSRFNSRYDYNADSGNSVNQRDTHHHHRAMDSGDTDNQDIMSYDGDEQPYLFLPPSNAYRSHSPASSIDSSSLFLDHRGINSSNPVSFQQQRNRRQSLSQPQAPYQFSADVPPSSSIPAAAAMDRRKSYATTSRKQSFTTPLNTNSQYYSVVGLPPQHSFADNYHSDARSGHGSDLAMSLLTHRPEKSRTLSSYGSIKDGGMTFRKSRLSRGSTMSDPSIDPINSDPENDHDIINFANSSSNNLRGGPSVALLGDNLLSKDQPFGLGVNRNSDSGNDEEFAGSVVSSRRSSDASSLDDVCFPIDSPRLIDPETGKGKLWPDLEVLEEFASEEREEFKLLNMNRLSLSPPQQPLRSMSHVVTDRDDLPFETITDPSQNKVDLFPDYMQEMNQPLLAHHPHKINEAEITGRLRPHHFVPWIKGSAKKKNEILTALNKGDNGDIDTTAANFNALPAPQNDKFPFTQYRFTYFREDLDATVHSPTISGLLQPNQNFADLFPQTTATQRAPINQNPQQQQQQQQQRQQSQPLQTPNNVNNPDNNNSRSSRQPTPGAGGDSHSQDTVLQRTMSSQSNINNMATNANPSPSTTPQPPLDPIPFWLDILNPTEEEMKVISKTFGIHPLTTEDIFLGETREKVELFRNYYLVCFRSFDVVAERAKNRQAAADSSLQRKKEKEFSKNMKFNNNNIKNNNKHDSDDDAMGRDTSSIKTSGTSSTLSSWLTKKTSKQKSRRKGKGKGRHNELEPLNMYIIVFHEGVLTFHFSPTVHPINVRRRARLLRDYINVSSDWISYALIDDITDGFAPMIEAIEEEVNNIEDSILRMHDDDGNSLSSSDNDSDTDSDDSDDSYLPNFDTKSQASHRSKSSFRGSSHMRGGVSSLSHSRKNSSRKWRRKGDTLRRIGECRKRVMSIMRLLGSKADVIKGFAKRCNEHWEVAPRSEIGMYLGDIQDHIVTMVQALNHYEKLLARSHSNCLAQINIDMTRASNETNDALGKITIIGTIVLPLNIVTGLWGMNVLVPGQESNNGLLWFWGILGSLSLFAIISFFFAKKVFRMI